MKLLLIAATLLALFANAAPPTGRYKTIVDQLNSMQASHSAISQTFSLGANDEGVEIFAIRISNNARVADPNKMGQLVVSTHHGNESAAPLFTMAFVKDLMARYESPEIWRGNLADMEWTIIPVLNVSGYNANQRHEHGVDPNRDYPNPCLPAGAGGKLKSIRNLMTLWTSRTFTGSVTVHGYDGSLTYPWGHFTDNTHTLDHNLYHQIFSKAAEANGYRVGTAADVVYPANGCYEDFVYWKYGAWSALLELESGSASDITNTVRSIATYFDSLNASPSNQHDFAANCTRGPDLRME